MTLPIRIYFGETTSVVPNLWYYVIYKEFNGLWAMSNFEVLNNLNQIGKTNQTNQIKGKPHDGVFQKYLSVLNGLTD